MSKIRRTCALIATVSTLTALAALAVGVPRLEAADLDRTVTSHFASADGWCNAGSAGAWGSFNSYTAGPDATDNNTAYIDRVNPDGTRTRLVDKSFALVTNIAVDLEPTTNHRLIVGVDANTVVGDPTGFDWEQPVDVDACTQARDGCTGPDSYCNPTTTVAVTTPPTVPPAPTTTEATPSSTSVPTPTSTPIDSTTTSVPTSSTTSTTVPPTSSSPSTSSPDTSEPSPTQPPPDSGSTSPTSPDPTGTPTSSPPLDEPQRCPTNPNEPVDSPLCGPSLPVTGPLGIGWQIWIGAALLAGSWVAFRAARRPEVAS